MATLGRLTVELVADSSGLTRGFAKAQQQVEGLRHTFARSQSVFGDVGFDVAKDLFGRSTVVNATKLGSLFGSLGGAIGIAAAAAAALAASIAASAERSRDFRIDNYREAARIWAEINGQPFKLTDELRNSAQVSESLRDTWSEISEAILRSTIGGGLRELKLGFRDLLEAGARGIGLGGTLDQIRAEKQASEEALKRAQEAKRRHEEELAEQRRAEAEQQAALERMQAKAREIMDSLRSPMQVFIDDVGQMQQLVEKALLSRDAFQQAVAQRVRELRDKLLAEEGEQGPKSAAAVQAGTTQFASALIQAQNAMLGRRSAEERSVALLEDILRELRKLGVQLRAEDI